MMSVFQSDEAGAAAATGQSYYTHPGSLPG